MLFAPQGHIAVNLVRDDNNAVAVAKLCKANKCLARPNNADRVVWIGKNKHLTVTICYGCKVLKINLIATLCLAQRILDNLKAVVCRHVAEGWYTGG